MLMYLLPNRFVENMYTPYPIMQYGSSLTLYFHGDNVCNSKVHITVTDMVMNGMDEVLQLICGMFVYKII